MTDLEARRTMTRVVLEWLEGRVSTEKFKRTYWQTRRELLRTNWRAFEGSFGKTMSSVDSAVDSYRAEDRAQFEIDEHQLELELRAAVDQLRVLAPEVLPP